MILLIEPHDIDNCERDFVLAHPLPIPDENLELAGDQEVHLTSDRAKNLGIVMNERAEKYPFRLSQITTGEFLTEFDVVDWLRRIEIK